MAMPESIDRLIHDFVGSAHVFSSAVDEVVEKDLIRKVGRDGFTLTQIRLLRIISQDDVETVGDVAFFLRVSNAAASKAIDRLVRGGLVRREPGHPDRRQIRLSLTRSGRNFLGAYDRGKRERLGVVFSRFSAEDLKRTADLLNRLSAGLMDEAARPQDVRLQCRIHFRDACPVRRLTKRDCRHVHAPRHRRGADKGTGE